MDKENGSNCKKMRAKRNKDTAEKRARKKN